MSENHQSSSSRGGKKINVRAARAEMVEKEFEYTNESNPFGDSHLTNKFVWGKKVEKELEEGKRQLKPESFGAAALSASQKKLEQLDHATSQVNEIKRIRQRREDHFQERAEIDKQKEENERAKLAEEAQANQEKEMQFQYRQQIERANLRVKQKRDSLVDLLVMTVIINDGEGLQGKSDEDHKKKAADNNSVGDGLGFGVGYVDFLTDGISLPEKDPNDLIKESMKLPLDKLKALTAYGF